MRVHGQPPLVALKRSSIGRTMTRSDVGYWPKNGPRCRFWEPTLLTRIGLHRPAIRCTALTADGHPEKTSKKYATRLVMAEGAGIRAARRKVSRKISRVAAWTFASLALRISLVMRAFGRTE